MNKKEMVGEEVVKYEGGKRERAEMSCSLISDSATEQ